MEENKQPKTSANGLILAILLVVAIIIALMWVMVYKLNEDKGELQKQVDSAKSEAADLKSQVALLQSKVGKDDKDNKTSNKTSNNTANNVTNDVEDDEDDEDDDNTVDNTVDEDDDNTVDNTTDDEE